MFTHKDYSTQFETSVKGTKVTRHITLHYLRFTLIGSPSCKIAVKVFMTKLLNSQEGANEGCY